MSDGPPTGPLRGPLRRKESHLWERERNDHYVEPGWCSERLFEALSIPSGAPVADPACGFGTIVDAACRAGLDGLGSDIMPRWDGIQPRPRGLFVEADFLDGLLPWKRAYAIVSNPPFGRAERFADLALARAETLVALLLPANWVQGQKRARWLATTPLYRVLFICPRPSMPPGHVLQAGGKPGNGTTDYAWLVWLRGFNGRPEIGWLHRDPPKAGALFEAAR